MVELTVVGLAVVEVAMLGVATLGVAVVEAVSYTHLTLPTILLV